MGERRADRQRLNWRWWAPLYAVCAVLLVLLWLGVDTGHRGLVLAVQLVILLVLIPCTMLALHRGVRRDGDA